MENFDDLLQHFVNKGYIKQGLQNEKSYHKLVKVLLEHRKLPLKGWNDQSIEKVVNDFSLMDSNNFMANAGVGEREGRVYSSLVSKRHYHLAHGIGRSGDISEVQPKAAGSSVIYKLTTSLATHAMEISGISCGMSCLVLPMATGMTLSMCLISLKKKCKSAKYVIWSRIDQKSCFKCIDTAGLTPLMVNNIIVDGEMVTNMAAIRDYLHQYGEEVLCILSTTSCFAPRQPDLIDEIAILAKDFNVGHIVNNAYGLQCPYICKLINRAVCIGRVDAGNYIVNI